MYMYELGHTLYTCTCMNWDIHYIHVHACCMNWDIHVHACCMNWDIHYIHVHACCMNWDIHYIHVHETGELVRLF